MLKNPFPGGRKNSGRDSPGPEMQLHPLTLSFPGDREKEYREYYFKQSLPVFRVAFLLVTLLYGLFAVLDGLLVREQQGLFFLIRFGIVIPFLLLIWLTSFLKAFVRIWQTLLFWAVLTGGTGIIVMIAWVPDNVTYYAGLMLVFSAGYFFIRLRFFPASLAGLLLLLIFNIAAACFTSIPRELWIGYNFFYLAANLVNMFAAYYAETSNRRNFFLSAQLDQKKAELEEVNRGLEEEILVRTGELADNEQKYRRLVEEINDVLFSFTPELIIEYMSPAVKNISGIAHDEYPGQNLSFFIAEDDLSGIGAELSGLRVGESVFIEHRIRGSADAELWVRSSIKKIRDDSERVFFQAIAQDVSGRRQAEKEAGILQAQLAQIQKMDSIGRLAGGVAHDFHNMLGVIIGHVDLLVVRKEESDPERRHLQEILKAAERSTDLTRQLLAFARRQPIAPRLLDLNDTVSGMLNMLRRLLGENIELDWRPGSGLGTVKLDPSQVDQILANLCVNSRDAVFAVSRVGRIVIATRNTELDAAYCAGHPGAVPGDYIELSVTDNGCGMEEKLLGHIFEPFFTTKEIGRGTGLGLATVYGIVKQNNGFIWVESRPGLGTTVRIYLPQFNENPKPEVRGLSAGRVVGGTETILIVEDEPSILEVSARMLESLGYRVLTASSPKAALALAENSIHEIDIMLTDVVMPGMSGRDLAEKMKASEPGLKCLFMSGYSVDVIAHHDILDEGVNFLQKPFTIKTLGAAVRQVLDQD